MTLPMAHSVADVRAQVGAWRRSGLSVALVPTMGALHEGHLALVRAGARQADRVVVSIFVNPTQFGPNEDFERYPRREEEDRALLADGGAHLLFAPGVAEMYPEGFQTSVTVARVSQGLCGDFRPVHFSGVATVVTKLLLQVLPDVALFGEKDYQQLQVIKRLVRDLDIPVRVVGVPTVRGADGLALSSRNAYLSPEERARATTLYRVLREIGDGVLSVEAAGAELLRAGFTRIDYLEIRDAETLEPDPDPDRPTRIIGAAWMGDTRLIDNVPGGLSVDREPDSI